MKAKLMKIHPDNPQMNKISEVVEVLRKGGIIIYPTDTVYAMGCDIHNQKAMEKLCKMKNLNPAKAHLSFICNDLSHISEYTRNLPNNIFKVMKKTLPGPFTFILNAGNKLPKILDTKKNTVGIRIPDHNIPRLLVKELDNPIATTSLKDASDDILEYPTDPEEIFEKYKNQVEIIIDGGFGNNTPSTMLDCTSGEIEIIREGLGKIEEFL